MNVGSWKYFIKHCNFPAGSGFLPAAQDEDLAYSLMGLDLQEKR